MFVMRKHLLTLFLAMPAWNAEAVLKTKDLFSLGGIHYFTNSCCSKVLKMATP
jgi:hypothetical protein